ncbi:hypothetical protein GOODEAATRI_024989 [Goodea atripinnis]|uniref:Uncharacterized protein n=1 Tax=Goodea atripinnis TaxID=208336 RepID=A0ABV0NXJ4_9TELE
MGMTRLNRHHCTPFGWCCNTEFFIQDTSCVHSSCDLSTRDLFTPKQNRSSLSTLVFQFPTDGKGAGTAPTPVMLTGTHGTYTMITMHTVITHIDNITMTRRSAIMMMEAAQTSMSTLIPQLPHPSCPFLAVTI